MVAFTCNACGASVKKAAVEKHYYQCPQTRTVNLTCIDCLQDFNASTYGAHVKCLTENEKYGAKGTVERSNNKGEIKQQDWLSMIADVYETHPLDPKHKQILEHIMNFDNIPRKKKPFLNFMKSSARMFSKSEAVIENLYDILDKEFKSRNPPNNNAKTDSAQNGTKLKNNCDETPTNASEVVSEKKKKKRQKHKSESREESYATNQDADTSPTELESENNPPLSDEANAENGEKTHLSKKEKKEKKKREKYLTELNAIEKYEKSEEVNGVEEETTGKKKKDKKNRHKSESEMETNGTKTHTEENVADETSNAPLERKLSKKEKKRKISENAAAEGEAKKKHKNLKGGDAPKTEKKKDKENDAEDEETQEFIKPDKFKIDKIVKIILQSQGGEVALKRLAKRVCTEYQFRCGVQDSDYIMAKFQKKIYNIPGVKILKDKAVLQ